jgi:hypothetical protein
VIDRSTDWLTVTDAEAELLAVFGSGSGDEAAAVSVSTVPSTTSGETAAVMVIVADAPAESDPTEHTTVDPAGVHVPTVDVAAVAESPSGKASVTTTLVPSEGPLLVTTIVNDADPPAVTVVGRADFVTARSTERVTVTDLDALLLEVSGSGVVDDAVAWFVNTVPALRDDAAWATITKTADPPGLTAPACVQVTVPSTAEHPALEPAGTNVRPVGSRSLAETENAADGPWLVTVRVKLTSLPASTVAELATLASERSALPTTVVLSVLVLFDGTGSEVVDDTVAVLATGPLRVGLNATVMLTDVAAPAARVPSEHVTVEPLGVQPGLADVNVVPAGRGSVTVTAVASAGP